MITEEKVKKFFNQMRRDYDIAIFDLQDLGRVLSSAMFDDIARKISRGNDTKIEEWLKTHSVSIPGAIWLCFEIGEGTEDELIEQIITLGHELNHTEQWRDYKAFFAIAYAVSRNFRAWAEARAMHSDLELSYAFNRNPNIYWLTRNLKNYRLEEKHIRVVSKHLRVYNHIAETGARGNGVARHICDYWGI